MSLALVCRFITTESPGKPQPWSLDPTVVEFFCEKGNQKHKSSKITSHKGSTDMPCELQCGRV